MSPPELSPPPGIASRGYRILAVFLLSCAPMVAQAQSYQRVAPKSLPANPVPALPLPGPARPVINPELVIVPSLQGIRLIGSSALLQPNGIAAAGVTSEVAFASPVTPSLQSFIGKPLTLLALAKIKAIVIHYYGLQHHPFVAVQTPPQDVTDGVIQLLITEYKVGSVHVSGNRWFSSGQIRDDIRLAPGDTIDSAKLEADLAWINQNPFRSAGIVASPGQLPATTDLGVEVQDRFPVQLYAGNANNGSRTTGTDLWDVGALWGNAFGTGQQLGYQFTTSGASFSASALNATIQLPWRDTLEIFGDYEQDRPDVGPDFGESGRSGQASLRYLIALPATPGFSEQLSLGYDFKTTNNNLAFGGTAVSGQSTEIEQFPLTYSATLQDAFGETTASDTLVLSPGGLGGANSTRAFRPSADQSGVAFARASYVYDLINIERETALPLGFTWIVGVTGQLASGNLLPSEQLNVGGIDTVRGYSEFVAGGADGLLVSTEIRTPVVPALSRFEGRFNDALQGDVFFDYAQVSNVRQIPGTPGTEVIDSTGFGARYSLSRYLTARVEFGFTLRDAPYEDKHGEFSNFVITASY